VNYSWSTPQSNSDGECSAVFCERPRDRGLDSSLGCSAMRSVYAASLCARRGQIHSRNDAIPVSRCVALTCSSQDAGCGTGNELPSDGTYKCTYDAAGNMTSQTNIANDYVTYYTWDYRNRLVEVKQEDNHNNVLNDEKFTYDINNNRIAVSLNGTPQLYTVYDGSNPYMDFNGSGQLTERYLYNPNALSQFYGQVNASGAVQWFLTDNIHSIRQVVSSSGNVLDAITYDPYGNILNQTNAANAPRFLYAGGAYDSLTGYDQFGRRYYSPVDGRWTSQDPLGFKAGDTDLYRYVANDPTNAIDPNGLDSFWIGAGNYGLPGYYYTRTHWFSDNWTIYLGEIVEIKGQTFVRFGGYLVSLDKVERELRENGAKWEEGQVDHLEWFKANQEIDVITTYAGAWKQEFGTDLKGTLEYCRQWGIQTYKDTYIAGPLVQVGSTFVGYSAKYLRDFSTNRTRNWSAMFKSEGEARAFACQKLGKNPVQIEPGKWRSLDGKWQYRAKPNDVSDMHVHLEEIDPATGEVIQNVHLRWPAGAGR
jgi:RHS repeat-associated protein